MSSKGESHKISIFANDRPRRSRRNSADIQPDNSSVPSVSLNPLTNGRRVGTDNDQNSANNTNSAPPVPSRRSIPKFDLAKITSKIREGHQARQGGQLAPVPIRPTRPKREKSDINKTPNGPNKENIVPIQKVLEQAELNVPEDELERRRQRTFAEKRLRQKISQFSLNPNPVTQPVQSDTKIPDEQEQEKIEGHKQDQQPRALAPTIEAPEDHVLDVGGFVERGDLTYEPVQVHATDDNMKYRQGFAQTRHDRTNDVAFIESKVTGEFVKVKGLTPEDLNPQGEHELRAPKSVEEYEEDIQDIAKGAHCIQVNLSSISLILSGLVAGISAFHVHIVDATATDREFLNMYSPVSDGIYLMYYYMLQIILAQTACWAMLEGDYTFRWYTEGVKKTLTWVTVVCYFCAFFITLVMAPIDAQISIYYEDDNEWWTDPDIDVTLSGRLGRWYIFNTLRFISMLLAWFLVATRYFLHEWSSLPNLPGEMKLRSTNRRIEARKKSSAGLGDGALVTANSRRARGGRGTILTPDLDQTTDTSQM